MSKIQQNDESRLSEELQVALSASRRAAQLVMPYYTNGVTVDYKQDNTPVTQADREAEQLIIEILSGRFPDYSVLGEESGERENSTERMWVIDPIDGTKNFIRQVPLFGIEIGLLTRDGAGENATDKFSVGVSNMPAMNEMVYADEPNGAFLNGKTCRVSEIADLSRASVTFSGINLLKAHGHEQAFLSLVEKVYRVRGFGDAFSFHLIATGRFEAVVQSRVNVWDVAGLVAVINAAGGRCTDWEGRPFSRRSSSIVASNGRIHDELIEIINR